MALPELIDDAVAEILLRLPPDKPAALFRAALVCKRWLSIATDPSFLRLYRTFHRAPPLLGFFYNLKVTSHARFISTAVAEASSPLPTAYKSRRTTRLLDCRHGRVLIRRKCSRDLVVWNPITDGWHDLRQKPPDIRYGSYSGVVICAVAGCDHRHCSSSGGHFLVICVGNDIVEGNRVHASTYSSKDRAWGKKPVTARLSSRPEFGQKRAALVGDGMYMYCSFGIGRYSKVLKYDLVKGSFTLIRLPYVELYEEEEEPVLMQNEDGSLGLAQVSGSQLEIWSAKVNPEGIAPWVRLRSIGLKAILPTDKARMIEANVTGFAEGVGIFFITTSIPFARKSSIPVAAYTLELKSCLCWKVKGPKKSSCVVFPFISFFTTDCGRSKLLYPVETN